MGSRSRARTSSRNTTQEVTTNNVDNRLIEGDGDIGGNINVTTGVTSGDNVLSITTSDFGALDAASEITDKALTFAEESVTAAGDLISRSNKSLEEAAGRALSVASEATRDETSRTFQFIIIGVVLVAGAAMFKGRR